MGDTRALNVILCLTYKPVAWLVLPIVSFYGKEQSSARKPLEGQLLVLYRIVYRRAVVCLKASDPTYLVLLHIITYIKRILEEMAAKSPCRRVQCVISDELIALSSKLHLFTRPQYITESSQRE